MFAAAIMKNTGILFANDMNKDRGKAVVGNFHRLGVINSVICSYDGRNFSKVSIILVKLWLQQLLTTRGKVKDFNEYKFRNILIL